MLSDFWFFCFLKNIFRSLVRPDRSFAPPSVCHSWYSEVVIQRFFLKAWNSSIFRVQFVSFVNFKLLLILQTLFLFKRKFFCINCFLEIVKHSEICYYIMTTPLSKNTFHYKPLLWLFLLRITRRIPCEELQMLSWPTGCPWLHTTHQQWWIGRSVVKGWNVRIYKL